MNKKKDSKVVPNVRFKGFTDDWKQRKLGECFTERVESMPDGELISVTINDGIRKFSELGRHDNSNDDKSKYKKVCVGDIAYNSMRMWQGASGYSPYVGIVSPAYTVLSPNSGVNSKCLAYQFKLPGMIHTFQINSQGITSDNWNLKYPALSEIKIFVSTDEEEQAKIAEYFENFDRLITFHQQKITLLTKLKKAMLEKMFPKKGTVIPEFRFNGFANAWEQRKLGEVGKCQSGIGFPDVEQGGKTGTPFYKVSDMNNYGNEHEMTCANNYVTNEQIVRKNWKPITEVPAVIFAKVGAAIMLNRKRLCRFPFLLDNNTMAYKFGEKWDTNFGKTLFEKIDLTELVQVGALPSYNVTDVENLDIKMPIDINEQKVIGEFFANLDTLITLHQRKIDKIKNMKKAMLDQMFI